MHRRTQLLFIACAALAGCQHFAMPEEGLPCLPGVNRQPVSLLISYAPGSGRPSVAMENCTVTAGTVITWQTPPGELRPFEIVYKGAAVGRNEAGVSGGRYRSRVTAGAVQVRTEFRYGIRANGHDVDPAIIVEPR